MLQDSMFTAFSNDHFLKQKTMENYATLNTSPNSFSYSSGLEFSAFRTTITSNHYANTGTVAAVGNQLMHDQHSTLTGGQNRVSNGSLIRNCDTFCENQRHSNMNGLSTASNNNNNNNARQGKIIILKLILNRIYLTLFRVFQKN